MRIGRAFVLTSSLAIAAACVSTSGLDNPPAVAPDAAGIEDAAVDESSQPVEDATPPSIDVDVLDAGGKLADLHEDFSGPLDPTLWYFYFPSPFSFSQASEQFHFFCPTKVTNGLGFIRTLRSFDANASSIHVNLVTAANTGIASESNVSFFWLKLADAKSSNAVEIGVASGNLYAKHFVGSTTGATVAATPYAPATMVWLRLRTTPSEVVWEYAPTNPGTWMPLFTEPPQMVFDTTTVELGIGGFPGTPGEIIVDSLNGP